MDESAEAVASFQVVREGDCTVAAGLVDELFLTTSPLLAGRSRRNLRLALVDRAEFLPATTVEAKLLTLRRAGSHLFARYQLPTGQAPGDG